MIRPAPTAATDPAARRSCRAALSTRIRRFTVVVYHRGHVGWRSDSRVPRAPPAARTSASAATGCASTAGSRPTSTPTTWSSWAAGREGAPGGRLGGAGGGAGDGRRADERGARRARAKASRSRRRRGRATSTPLDASVLLSVDELRAVTSYAGDFIVEKLTDLPTTPSYDSRHFKAVGKTETFDAALRVWKLTPAGADARFAKLAADAARRAQGRGRRSLDPRLRRAHRRRRRRRPRARHRHRADLRARSVPRRRPGRGAAQARHGARRPRSPAEQPRLSPHPRARRRRRRRPKSPPVNADDVSGARGINPLKLQQLERSSDGPRRPGPSPGGRDAGACLQSGDDPRRPHRAGGAGVGAAPGCWRTGCRARSACSSRSCSTAPTSTRR